MPVPVIILVVVTWLFYSIAVLGEKFVIKRLTFWLILSFAAGFLLDTYITYEMFKRTSLHVFGSGHSFGGTAAYFIMLVHFGFALLTARGSQRSAELFHRYSLIPYSLWTLTLISGALFHLQS